jgi:hypothetical protein
VVGIVDLPFDSAQRRERRAGFIDGNQFGTDQGELRERLTPKSAQEAMGRA